MSTTKQVSYVTYDEVEISRDWILIFKTISLFYTVYNNPLFIEVYTLLDILFCFDICVFFLNNSRNISCEIDIFILDTTYNKV